jgi:anti-anti-sigma factor
MNKQEKSVSNEAYRIKVDGDLTMEYIKELEASFIEHIDKVKGGEVVLDLKNAGRIDSQGIALCIGMKKECASKKIDITIDTNSEINKLFKMLKIIPNNTVEAGTL